MSAPYRQYRKLDHILIECGKALDTVFSHTSEGQRPSPAIGMRPGQLSKTEKKQSSGLMRVNHTGEVCAQALYRGQALTAKSAETRAHLLAAAEEENDHLLWCQHRLNELEARTSLLNLLWYIGSFKLGVVTGMLGDPLSLGFVVETENQVMAHLESHLRKLPANDHQSRVILETMSIEEEEHANHAKARGSRTLPFPIRLMMRVKSKLMTKSAYYI